jgi:hypothetical protein
MHRLAKGDPMPGFKPPPISEVDKKIEAWKRKIHELQSSIADLEAYKAAVTKLASKASGLEIKTVAEHPTITATPATAPPAAAARVSGMKKPVNDTSGLAYRVLSSKAVPMRLADVVAEMQVLGWQSSGDARTDRSRVYSAMHGMPQKFRNPGRGMWEALPQLQVKN